MTVINQNQTLIAIEAWNYVNEQTGEKIAFLQAISPGGVTVSNEHGKGGGTRANLVNLRLNGHLPENEILPENFPRMIESMSVIGEQPGKDGIIRKTLSDITFGKVLK